MSGVKMDLRTITNKAKVFAKELWRLDFDIKIEISSRMTSTLGCVAYRPDKINHKEIPTKMKIAARLINGDYKEETIDGVILHECCHFAMMKLGKPSSDGHPVFEAELRRIGASSTRTLHNVGNVHEFCCSKCGRSLGGFNDQKTKTILKKMQNPFRLIQSKCCKAPLQYKGKVYKEDDNKTREALDNKAQELKMAMSITQSDVTIKKTFIVVPNGANGKVTNNTLMAVLKEVIKAQNIEGVKELRKQYPAIFESSFKYLSKKEQEFIKEVA